VKGRKKSGISPVVATVILVAVAIVIAIAVAFWASGLVGIFTRFEKLEILSAYQGTGDDVDKFVIRVRNTGSSPTSVTEVVLNGMFVEEVDGCQINVGRTAIITIPINGLKGGVTYEVMLRTSGGKQYPTAVLAHSDGTADGPLGIGGAPDCEVI